MKYFIPLIPILSHYNIRNEEKSHFCLIITYVGMVARVKSLI